jgi:hypothetical protein
MNIFLLDWDVRQCAKYHCDKHVVKMNTRSRMLYSHTGIIILEQRRILLYGREEKFLIGIYK